MIERWIERSAAYLSSAEARRSLADDPYWPKWNSPWWHIALLWELGRADAVPREAAEGMLGAIDAKYLRFFPNPTEPLPPGKDARRDAACHCALGNMYQALSACGLDLDVRAPWIRTWLLRYQLPDGGLNCDEKAYGRAGPSSIQSTLPALEAVLSARRPLTPAEEAYVDRGAGYLLDRRLAYRRRDGGVMDESFLTVGFPRFYDYDVLRGLAFLAEWSRVRRKPIPAEAVASAVASLRTRFPDGLVRVEKAGLVSEGSWRRLPDGTWGNGAATTFLLLDAARRVGSVSEALTESWRRCGLALGD